MSDPKAVHENFQSFVAAVVSPRRAANPDHIRLDGMTTGGSREVAGLFRHRGSVWTVHADTHYEPLLIAYQSMENGVEPFTQESTERGLCLVLSPDLRAKQTTPYKHMYIYSWESR